MSFLSGDIAGGITKGLGALINGIGLIGAKSAAISKYWTEKSIKELEDYTERVESEVNKLLSRIDDIREAYGDIKVGTGTIRTTLSDDLGLDDAMKKLWNLSSSVKGLSDSILNIPAFDFSNLLGVNTSLDSWRLIIEMSGRSVDELIQAEITRGQQIQKTYETAVSKENDLYAKRKESIEKKKLEKKIEASKLLLQHGITQNLTASAPKPKARKVVAVSEEESSDEEIVIQTVKKPKKKRVIKVEVSDSSDDEPDYPPQAPPASSRQQQQSTSQFRKQQYQKPSSVIKVHDDKPKYYFAE
jgi:hypothetical protein